MGSFTLGDERMLKSLALQSDLTAKNVEILALAVKVLAQNAGMEELAKAAAAILSKPPFP